MTARVAAVLILLVGSPACAGTHHGLPEGAGGGANRESLRT